MAQQRRPVGREMKQDLPAARRSKDGASPTPEYRGRIVGVVSFRKYEFVVRSHSQRHSWCRRPSSKIARVSFAIPSSRGYADSSSAGLLGAIGEHPPPAVRRAPEIDRAEMQVLAAGRRAPAARAQIARIGIKQAGRQVPLVKSRWPHPRPSPACRANIASKTVLRAWVSVVMISHRMASSIRKYS